MSVGQKKIATRPIKYVQWWKCKLRGSKKDEDEKKVDEESTE